MHNASIPLETPFWEALKESATSEAAEKAALAPKAKRS